MLEKRCNAAPKFAARLKRKFLVLPQVGAGRNGGLVTCVTQSMVGSPGGV
jgi:hypothetical protein